MQTQAFYQISLVAAYIAGMVALFAPCCISYLFPAYLGNIFRERKQVLLMTFVYSLGIFVVMMPVVLGARVLATLFFRLHDQTYIVGGIFMLFIAMLSFLGIKLPMPRFGMSRQKNGNDILSTFTLGIFSGITSACCAPVLIGVMALGSLTPSTIQALGVGAVYVLGMVTPLYVASVFIHKRNILEKPILKRKLTVLSLGGRQYPIFISNVIAGLIFAITGSLMLILTSAGKLAMPAEATTTKLINATAMQVTEITSKIPGIDLIFLAIVIYLFYRFIKDVFSYRKRKQKSDTIESMDSCCTDHGQHSSSNKDSKHDENNHDYYTCPMHPEIKEDKLGKCPKCGGMDLVKKSSLDSGEAHHDHASMMATPEAAADFLKRFFIVSTLLIPLAILSEPAVKFLSVPDFALRSFLEFGIATVIFYFGLVFFEHARHEIKMRQYGMMTLVSLGVGAGYLFSAASTFIPVIQVEFYLEISTLIWVLLFGHFLEAKSSTAAGDALQEVAKLLPKQAHLKTKNGVKEVELSKLKEGDIVIVKPGEKVPADGEIVKGSGNFNEAHITGESKPAEKDKGTEVVAGAISIDGSVEVKLMRVGESSTIGQIQNLISAAKQTKPSAQRLADRAAKWLTFSALTVSLITLLVWTFVIGEAFVFAATLAITVLVIACPHALGLAIPTVSTIATKLAVNNGVFIKDMGKIEIVKDADYVVFDKTGTLTKGEFGVTDVIELKTTTKNTKTSNGQREILTIAGAIESHSSHVIGMAILEYLKKSQVKFLEATNIKNLAGRGMEARISGETYFLGNKRLMEERKVWTSQVESVLEKLSSEGKTPVFVASKVKILGIIALSDQVKDESKQAVVELHKLGVKVAMLTGDTKAAAQPVAKKLGIDTVFAEVLPEDKYKHIKELQNKGNVVLMAGDGVNDAPALTQANAGVAIGAGTDVAVEAGDIVLTQSNPQHIVRLIVLSRKVYNKMLQNLWWALGYNILAIPAAAGLFIPFGFRLTPAVGALLMSLSSVIVVINALTLRKTSLDA